MKYRVKAYADAEYGLKEQVATIEARNYKEARETAWHMFHEYHELSVSEVEGD